ncbi:unnamed protein product [Prorocentrum cordatum]|uniref:Phosphodiesterase n=1 Tax=Prorocentrum cordatum TaxID=2364126 RepID=A0ABN9SQ39_9DINO|nr:unnamed protein product [Polarella glacialis]
MSELHRLPEVSQSLSLLPCQGQEFTAVLPPEWKHPTSFLCPISHQCMHDPVMLADGHTYERQHIERWLSNAATSPVTGLELANIDMHPNHTLHSAIDEYFNEVFWVHRHAIRKTIHSRRGSRDFSADGVLKRTLEALIQSSLLVNSDHGVEYILRQIMDEARKLVGAEVASVFLMDTVRQELSSTVNSTDGELRIPMGVGIAGHVATTGKTIIINDAYADDRFNIAVDKKTGFKTQNVLCAPLRVRNGDVVGVVQLINKTGGGMMDTDGPPGALLGAAADGRAGGVHPFTAEDAQFLHAFASQAAAAVAHDAAHGLGGPRQPAKRPEEPPAVPAKTLELRGAGRDPLGLAAQGCRVGPEGTQGKLCARAPLPYKQPSEAWAMPQEAAALLEESLDGWDLDVVRLAALTDGRPLSSLGCFLFERLGLVAHFGLDREKLRGFFLELERGYDDAVQYHNRRHAASVLHLTHAVLRRGGLAQKAAAQLHDADGALVTMACLLAAAAHDFEHVGRTNDFLVKTGHDRALRHNDRHVNENHHAAASFALLQRPGLDFLEGLSREEFRRLRGLFVELILATDMASNKSILDSFTAALDRPAGASGAPCPGRGPRTAAEAVSLPAGEGPCAVPEEGGFAPRSAAEAVLLLQMALKGADLGHLTLSRALHLRFVRDLEAELFAQGDQESALGLEVSCLMDRERPGVASSQVGFFEAVALPVFRSLARACRALQPLLRGAEDNHRYWQGLPGPAGAGPSAAPSGEGLGGGAPCAAVLG